MRRIIAMLLLASLLCVAVPAFAYANETGDDPTTIANVTAPEETAEAAAFDSWTRASSKYATGMSGAPSAFLWTTTCPQQRSYWCGPAAVQTALTWFNVWPSQALIAAWLGTTTNGTSMTRVDDVLRLCTGKPYTYHRITTSSDFYNHVAYSLGSRKRPMIVDVRIAAPWGPYRKDHLGHIICMDAFDWGRSVVWLDDSYNEASWVAGGGATGGHTMYDRSLVLNALALHPLRQIVY